MISLDEAKIAIEQYKPRFPLFSFSEPKIVEISVWKDEGYHKEKHIIVTITLSKNSSMGCDISDGVISNQILRNLTNEHARVEKQKELHAEFQNLWIYISTISNEPAALYVRRSGADAEAISKSPANGEAFTKEELTYWNNEAGKALQPGMFFCSYHDKAEPIEEYAFFFFAGKYCKKTKIEKPSLYKTAQEETYN